MKNETTTQYRKRLQSLFNSSGLLPIDPPEERHRIYTALTCNIPKINLYQYRCCSQRSIFNFWKNQQTLVNPTKFNDPFDSLPFFNNKSIENSYAGLTQEKFQELLEIIKNRSFTQGELLDIGGTQQKEILRSIGSILDKENKEKFYSEFEQSKQRGRKITLLLANYVAKILQNSIRVSCFSEVCNSPIMWGHYADSGKGFCVKYEITPFNNIIWDIGNKCIAQPNCENKSVLSILPIIYQSRRYDYIRLLEAYQGYFAASIFNLKLDLSYHDLLDKLKIACFKSSAWKYEKEWRLILEVNNTEPDYYTAPFFSAAALYLGPHIAPDDETMLLEYAKIMKTSQGAPLPIYKMSVNWFQKDFSLSAIPYQQEK